jgi:putative DNA primase/helicase
MGIGVKCASDVQMKAPEWLWPDWVARGKLHLLAGAAGTGKTTIAMAIAAAVTQGGMLPDGTMSPAGDVLIWSGEDDIAETLTPKLYACGANTDRVHFINCCRTASGLRTFDPMTDLDYIEESLRDEANPPKLLIIDPIVSVTTGLTNKAVRDSLTPWVRMAEKYGIALIGITHVSKSSSKKALLDRVLGAQAFGAIARVVMMTARTPRNETVLLRIKSNISAAAGGFVYQLHGVDFPSPSDEGVSLHSSFVEWGNYIDLPSELIIDGFDADDAPPQRLDESVAFLRAILAEQPRLQTEIMLAASQVSHSTATIRRAKAILRIQSFRWDGRWWWKLPAAKQGAQPTQGAHENDEHLEHVRFLPARASA